MTRIAKILKDKSGNSMIFAAVTALAIIIMASAVFESIRLFIIVSGVRDALEKAATQIATANYDELYSGLREGYTGAYEYTDLGWHQRIDADNIYSLLESELGVTENKGIYIKYAGDKLEYKLSNVSLEIVNAPLAPKNKESANKFNVGAKSHIEVPLSFGWEVLPTIKMNLDVKAGYVPKF